MDKERDDGCGGSDSVDADRWEDESDLLLCFWSSLAAAGKDSVEADHLEADNRAETIRLWVHTSSIQQWAPGLQVL